MKYIISSWKGFEIDSSEFWVVIQPMDVPRLVRAFLDSPFIENRGKERNSNGKRYVPTFLRAVKLAKRQDKALLASITLKGKNILELAEEYEKNPDVDIVDLTIAIKFLLEEFPHLIYEFNNETITFNRKTGDYDVCVEYTFNIAGLANQYMTNWYDSDQWESVFQSISRKAPVRWNTWI